MPVHIFIGANKLEVEYYFFTNDNFYFVVTAEKCIFANRKKGIDRDVALRMFTQFISENDLNSQQEEYLKAIINYVCENGDIKANTLINDSPFCDYDVIDI